MTTICATTTPERAWISQDTAVYDMAGSPPMGVLAKDSDYQARVVREQIKMMVHDDLRLIVGVAGALAHRDCLSFYIHAGRRDIDNLHKHLPAMLAAMQKDMQTYEAHILVVAAGWSESQGCVVGYGFDQMNGFQPRDINYMHAMSPECDPTAPNAPELERLWVPATKGKNVEALHGEVFANHQWLCAQGLMRAGVLVSGDFELASVDQHGARMVRVSNKAAKAA